MFPTVPPNPPVSDAFYQGLLTSNLFGGSTNISNVEIRAMSTATFGTFAAAADAALNNNNDPNVGLQNPLWQSATQLYAGPASSILLDTGNLTAQTFIARVAVTDALNGGVNYGLAYFSLVPEPSSFLLSGLGALGVIGYSWRCRKRANV
jgi:hypothetical protein